MQTLLQQFRGVPPPREGEDAGQIGECAMSRARQAAEEEDDEEEALLASSFQQSWTYAEDAEEKAEATPAAAVVPPREDTEVLEGTETMTAIELEHAEYEIRQFGGNLQASTRAAAAIATGLAAATIAWLALFASRTPLILAAPLAAFAAWAMDDDDNEPTGLTRELLENAAFPRATWHSLGRRLLGAVAASGLGLGPDEACVWACAAGSVLVRRAVAPLAVARDIGGDQTVLSDIEEAQGSGRARRLREATQAVLTSDSAALQSARVAATSAAVILLGRFAGHPEAGLLLCFHQFSPIALAIIAATVVVYYRLSLVHVALGAGCALHGIAALACRDRCRLGDARARAGIAALLALLLRWIPIAFSSPFCAVCAGLTPGGLARFMADWGSAVGGRPAAAAAVASVLRGSEALVVAAFGASPGVLAAVATAAAAVRVCDDLLSRSGTLPVETGTVGEAVEPLPSLPRLTTLREIAAALSQSDNLVFTVSHKERFVGLVRRGVAALLVATKSVGSNEPNPVYAPHKSPPLSVAALRLDRRYRRRSFPDDLPEEGVVDLGPHCAPPALVVYAQDRLSATLDRIAKLQVSFALVLDPRGTPLGLLLPRRPQTRAVLL